MLATCAYGSAYLKLILLTAARKELELFLLLTLLALTLM